jgi:4a-hydroxytetrahydrobiopterin dehydratase
METRQHLVEMKCTACRGGEPTLTPEEIERLLPEIPGWSVVEKEGIKRLQQTFKFKNFREALDFTNSVGQIAEEEGHHPSILTEWGRVTVTWWTHKIKGLHKNDFIMAAKTSAIFSKFVSSKSNG